MGPVKVLIADDHPLIREGLVKIINMDPAIEVVGEAVDGEDVIGKTEGLNPDIIIMDLNMPKIDGLEAARIIKSKQPKKAVHAGETVIHPKITSMLFRQFERAAEYAGFGFGTRNNDNIDLTPREAQVLKYITKGIHNKEIASQLFISEKTVKNHITSIFRKLQVDDRTQAALSAIKLKLVNLKKHRQA